MANETEPAAKSGPPELRTASGRDWALSIVLYPSGPHLEVVEAIEGSGSRMVYSESLHNVNLAAKVLKEKATAPRPPQRQPLDCERWGPGNWRCEGCRLIFHTSKLDDENRCADCRNEPMTENQTETYHRVDLRQMSSGNILSCEKSLEFCVCVRSGQESVDATISIVAKNERFEETGRLELGKLSRGELHKLGLMFMKTSWLMQRESESHNKLAMMIELAKELKT